MPNKFIFADEAGDFTFNREHNVSKFFILCTVLMDECEVATDLLRLRRQLAWDGHELGEYFHATTDKQAVRNAVFDTIMRRPFSVQSTIMEKCKAQPQTRTTRARFYQYGYFYHFKFGPTKHLNGSKDEALVTTASLGTKKERQAFQDAVADVMRQTKKVKDWRADFMPCQADPCLQVADYCAWAIQRKYESGGKDCRSYDIIKDRITHEYDLFGRGLTTYY